jgi:DNA repair protein RadC
MNNYSEYQQEAIRVALSAIQRTLTNSDVMNSPEEVQNYLTLKLADEPDEWFGVMYLTSQHRLIRFERLFRGTINASQVHVRVFDVKVLDHFIVSPDESCSFAMRGML